MPQSADRLPGLHAMRLFAALCVFVAHANYSGLSYQPVLYQIALYFMPLAVPMFFVASAFALMYSTQTYIGQPNWVWKFYSKRFWRIAPLFYIACIASIAIQYSRGGNLPSWDALLLNALLINNLVPQHAMSLAPAGWTVGVEVMFYLVFPLILLFVRTLWAAFAVLIASIIASQLVHEPFSQFPQLIGTYADFAFVTFAPSFAFGVISYLTFQRLRELGWGAPTLSPKLVWVYHLGFAALTLAIAATIAFKVHPLRDAGRWDLVLAGLFFAVVNVWWNVRPAMVLNSTLIQYQAERSYSIYLMHALIVPLNVSWGQAAYRYFESYIGGWAMTPALLFMYAPVILVSIATHELVEKRGIETGRAFDALFKSKPKQRPAPEAA
jgi:peptidoglycan/LPS O-acetylase OafA/YrhL